MSMKPSIGRIVWFYPPGPRSPHYFQPHAAQIAYVHRDDKVNLAVVDSAGNPYSATSVPLYQPDQVPAVETGPYATWMPYQVQAARESETKAVLHGENILTR